MCIRDKNPSSSERREYAEGPGKMNPAFLEVGMHKERAIKPLSKPLGLFGWQVTHWPAEALSLSGGECGEGRFSAEVEPLGAHFR